LSFGQFCYNKKKNQGEDRKMPSGAGQRDFALKGNLVILLCFVYKKKTNKLGQIC